MKKIILLLSLLFASALAVGQANTLGNTTFAVAVTTPDTKGNPASQFVTVSSATGISKNTTSIYVDAELMAVVNVNGTTLTVTRGAGGTVATTHDTTSKVWVGSNNFFQTSTEQGSCTLANLFYHPHIDIKDKVIFWCINSFWVGNPVAPELTGYRTTGRFRDQVAVVGSTAFGSLGNATTDVSGGLFCSDVFVPRTRTATGIGILNGTAGSDSALVILYDAGGVLVANSAIAGTANSGSNTFQERSFTSAVLINGPADYFICYQPNGSTDTVRTVAASTFIDVLTKNVTGGVFGTIPSTITVPTTFSANVGPFGYIF